MHPPSPATIDARVAKLEALEAIRTLKHRYAEITDRCVASPDAANVAAFAGLFAEDAEGDYAQFGKFRGREALAGFVGTVLPAAVSWTSHFMMNPIVTVEGPRADGRWSAMVQAVFKADAAAGPKTLYARYEDTYVHTAHGWLFHTVVVRFDTPT